MVENFGTTTAFSFVVVARIGIHFVIHLVTLLPRNFSKKYALIFRRVYALRNNPPSLKKHTQTKPHTKEESARASLAGHTTTTRGSLANARGKESVVAANST